MTTYFCTTQKTTCPEDCSFRHCPEKLFYGLRSTISFSGINRLPYHLLFKPASDRPLRCGDIIILYIQCDQELEQVIAQKEMIEPFRLVLIVRQDLYQNSRSYHLLNPRFVTTTEQSINNLKEVVQRLADKSSNSVQEKAINTTETVQFSAR